jgi:hypothetical protein
MNTTDAHAVLLQAKAGYDRARAGFLNSANGEDETFTRQMSNALRIYRAKLDCFLATFAESDILRYYLSVLTKVGEHLIHCARVNEHPYGQEMMSKTFQCMHSWQRIEAEVASLGFEAVPLAAILKSGLNPTTSRDYAPLFDLLGHHVGNRYVEPHAIRWLPADNTSADRTDEMFRLAKELVAANP